VEKVEGQIAKDQENEPAVLADQRDLLRHYIMEERPEHELAASMQKVRYYCEFPGDAWNSGLIIKNIKKTFDFKDEFGNINISKLPRRITFDKYGTPTIDTGRSKVFSFDQTSCELLVVDPADTNVFLSDNKDTVIAILSVAFFRFLFMALEWLVARLNLGGKSEFTQHLETLTESRAKEFNTKEDNKMDTGIKFKEIGGIDQIKKDIIDVISMLKGEPAWNEIGAKMPKGLLLVGPPGTGKTLLAKAMASEAKMPFYSTNGAEYVDMYSGVAAGRIRSLFAKARENKAKGSIIFIDEIDAASPPDVFLASPIASISSINIIEGDLSFACLNKSLTLEAPTPTNISTKSDPESEKNGTLASPATALASKVFPVPGKPTNKAPLGIFPPRTVYFRGFLRKSTIS
jgi:hypothetical protein